MFNSEVRQAYADWIGREPYDAFLTVTSANRTHPEAMLKRCRTILSMFAKHLHGPNAHRKNLYVDAVIALERHQSYNPHAHLLLRFPFFPIIPAAGGECSPLPLGNLKKIAANTGGFCRIQVPRCQDDVVDYCSKYSIKEGEIFFTPHWKPDTGQRVLPWRK